MSMRSFRARGGRFVRRLLPIRASASHLESGVEALGPLDRILSGAAIRWTIGQKAP